MVQFTSESELLAALESNGIHVRDYKPAFGGESVGLDLYNAGPELIIWPIGLQNLEDAFTTKIPTGLRLALPSNFAAMIFQRGSITKTPLIHRAGLGDPGYSGEYFIPVLNFSTEPYVIKRYQKLPFQIVVVPVVSQFNYIEPDVYEQTTRHSIRKDACLGSSDVLAPRESRAVSVPDEVITVLTDHGVLSPTEYGYL